MSVFVRNNFLLRNCRRVVGELPKNYCAADTSDEKKPEKVRACDSDGFFYGGFVFFLQKGLILGVYEGDNKEPIFTAATQKFNDHLGGKLHDLLKR